MILSILQFNGYSFAKICFNLELLCNTIKWYDHPQGKEQTNCYHLPQCCLIEKLTSVVYKNISFGNLVFTEQLFEVEQTLKKLNLFCFVWICSFCCYWTYTRWTQDVFAEYESKYALFYLQMLYLLFFLCYVYTKSVILFAVVPIYSGSIKSSDKH